MTPINQLITEEMIQDSLNFATSIINGNNQYDRIPTTVNERIERTFIGKLAEVCFLEFLRNSGVNYQAIGMFEIFNGQHNTDDADFMTPQGHSIDVKTASKPFHSRIMIPIDQFVNTPKDYYVGIKINANLVNEQIVISSINNATIYGFCTYQQLEEKPTDTTQQHPCKSFHLNQLTDIELLVNQF